MAKPLVIVESPAKARTIARFLGGDYVVESSIGHIRDLPRNAADVPAEHKGAVWGAGVGHIRDLPRNAADVPAEHKGEAWARLGVDVDHGFKPLYVVARE